MPIYATPHAWVLETRSTGYALGINEAGLLVHRYWGPRLPFVRDYPPAPNPPNWASFNSPAHLTPSEFPASGGMSFVEPCLKITFADGVRDTILHFVAAEIKSNDQPELHIRLVDSSYALHVTLVYRIYEPYDLIERYAIIANKGETPIAVERVWSAQWHLPYGDDFFLTHATGRWLDEGHLRREPLTHGVTVIESRRLTSSHHHSPWFLLDRDAYEESGAVWFGALAWSGNWKLAAEVTDFMSTRVSLGLNDWDFGLRLAPHTQFVTPACYAGFSSEGFGGASRRMHAFIHDRILPHGSEMRKVLYNSWEATEFAVAEASQARLAELAAAIGVELFVVDDGWFQGRDSDQAGLGDWWPDTRKFPNGLTPLIRRVQQLGMDFGLWVEPEMVNRDSNLYRAHPDWVLHFPTRPRTEARNQLILNLARQDVQEHLIAQLDHLLSSHEISFMKWDMNRNVSEPGWPDYSGEQREVWVRYVEGLYRVWGELRRRHPQVIWQSCSGGGGRADLGILRLADQIWVSDNTEATARLTIQESFSHIFPACTMENWVTDAGRGTVPLRFRFHVSMCGALGIGGNLIHWTAEEQAEAAALIAQYKAVRHIILRGSLYRLRSPRSSPFSALQYLSPEGDEGLLFAFRTYTPEPTEGSPLYLRGLAPQARYEVEGLGIRSGTAWAHTGLRLQLGNFESSMLRIWRR